MNSESLRQRSNAYASARSEMPKTSADGALMYAAAILQDRIEWTSEAIGSCEECGDFPDDDYDGHRDELDALNAVVREIRALAAKFGDPSHYYDGRYVSTHGAEIIPTYGAAGQRIWPRDPSQEGHRSWRGELLSDPGEPSPGIYEVSIDPHTQAMQVRVVKST